MTASLLIALAIFAGCCIGALLLVLVMLVGDLLWQCRHERQQRPRHE
jgi:hypothetical protein